MTETEWFQGRGPNEEQADLLYWLRVLIVIAFAVALAVLIGCTAHETPTKPQVCYLSYIGKTEEGYTVVLQTCVSPEEFRAAQK